jgi:small-conductance mechanosensitive channel
MCSRCLPYAFAVVLQALLVSPALPAHAGPPVPPPPAATPAPRPAGAPVVVEGRTLFYVPARMFTFSPEERARAIADHVRWLSEQSPAQIRAVHPEDAETTTAIMSGEVVIATVTDSDAQAAGEARQELAKEYTQAIQRTALALRDQTSARVLLFAALYSLIATVLLAVILRLLGFGFSKFYTKLESWHGVYIRSIRIQQLELLPAERITATLLVATRGLRLVLSLALLYAYITTVTNFFPWTRGYSAVLLDYVLAPVRIVWNALTSYVPDLFFVAVIAIVAYYVTKFVKFLFSEVANGSVSLPGFFPEWAMPTYRIVRLLIIAFTLVVAFPYLPGSKSPAFQGVSIFFGVLLSLGSSSAVANVVAGTVLTYTRAFQLGDRVQIGDAVGDIIEKTLLVTRVRTIKNEDIAIPNGMVLGSHIINFSSAAKQQGLILHTSVTIGYDAPWRHIHALLISAAEATSNILREPRPFVLQTSLDDFYVSYQINAFTNRPNQMAQTYSELHQNIQDKFYEAGVEIMSPHQFGVRDGNHVAIPADQVPQGYVAPPFRVARVQGEAARGTEKPEPAS